jgi:IS30 family transposase
MRKNPDRCLGKDMGERKQFTSDIEIAGYFVQPRFPCERGTSESTNGLLLQYFPNGRGFEKISTWEVKRVQ